jgi:uncharacterized protein (DUF2267 family)
MPATGLDTFDETLQKTNALLKDIETRRDWIGHRNFSYAALRAVLHTLRDRLTVDETADFAAQLPMLVRGLYYEGWNPSRVPVKLDAEEFMAEVRAKFRFDIEGDVEDLVSDVLQSLRKYVTEDELDDVFSLLPKKLSSLLRTATAN